MSSTSPILRVLGNYLEFRYMRIWYNEPQTRILIIGVRARARRANVAIVVNAQASAPKVRKAKAARAARAKKAEEESGRKVEGVELKFNMGALMMRG